MFPIEHPYIFFMFSSSFPNLQICTNHRIQKLWNRNQKSHGTFPAVFLLPRFQQLKPQLLTRFSPTTFTSRTTLSDQLYCSMVAVENSHLSFSPHSQPKKRPPLNAAIGRHVAAYQLWSSLCWVRYLRTRPNHNSTNPTESSLLCPNSYCF